MTLKTLVEIEVQDRTHAKRKRKSKIELLTTKLRLDQPRQGQDTRLCRDATNTQIKAVKSTTRQETTLDQTNIPNLETIDADANAPKIAQTDTPTLLLANASQ